MLDLYKVLARGQAARRSERRHTTLDPDPFRSRKRKASEAATRWRADPEDERRFLEKLVEVAGDGGPLSAVVPVAQGIPKIIGTGLTTNQFEFYLEGLRAAMTALGLTGDAQPSQAVRRHRAAMGGDLPPLPSASGVRRRTRQDVPLAVRRFDAFAAMAAEGNFADSVGAGMRDGLPPGIDEITGALFAALRSSVLAGDLNGIRQAATEFGALAAAIAEVTQAAADDPEPAQRRSTRPTPPTRRVRATGEAAGGRVVVQKAGNQVVAVDVDGQLVPARDVTFVDGKVRRRSRGRS